LAEGCQQPLVADLLRCVIHKNYAEVERIISLHPEIITETDPLGRNALHAAIETENVFYEMSIFLIDQNKDIVYAKDNLFGKTPIEYLDLPIPEGDEFYTKLSKLVCKLARNQANPGVRLLTIENKDYTNTCEAEEYKELKARILLIDELQTGESENLIYDIRCFTLGYFKYLLTHTRPDDLPGVIQYYDDFLLRALKENDSNCKACKEEKPDLKTCCACSSVKQPWTVGCFKFSAGYTAEN
jgi:hypothetical protein